MNNILYISFYTKGYYESIINKYLIPSLKKWNLTYLTKEYPDTGKWIENVKYKAVLILEIMKLTTNDLVFLDADAEIIQYPSLFNEIHDCYDLAVHYLDWYKFWRNQNQQTKFELLSGTLFIRNNNKNIKLVEQWIEETKKSNLWEQKVLENLLPSYQNINIYKLPISYCQIIKLDNKIPENSVIIHHQCSRGVKK
jgi:hypothetical protein